MNEIFQTRKKLLIKAPVSILELNNVGIRTGSKWKKRHQFV